MILAECRLGELYGAKNKDGYEILDKKKGKEYEGVEYIPLFDYYSKKAQDGCFKVLVGEHVTSDAGTGIVHTAPTFGEEDYKIGTKYGIVRPDNLPQPLDDNGFFNDQIADYKEMYFKDADKEIIRNLRSRNRLFHETQVKHSYPFCWRTDTPLVYKAVHSWFIGVTTLKDKLLVNNKKSRWVPSFAQENRFNNWLENA